jgi:hypothetical protein
MADAAPILLGERAPSLDTSRVAVIRSLSRNMTNSIKVYIIERGYFGTLRLTVLSRAVEAGRQALLQRLGTNW